MKRRAILALTGGAALTFSGIAAVAALTPKSNIAIVSDTAAFDRAIAGRKTAMTVRLAPGYYPLLRIWRKPGDPGPPLIVESADPKSRAVIGELDVAHASDVTIKNLDFERRDAQTGGKYVASFRNAPHAKVISSRFRGTLSGMPAYTYGVMLRESSDARVERSEFSGLRFGVGFIGGDRMAIVSNEFRDLQTDAIRGEGADDLLIAGNVIGDFYPVKGDHPDGIQLWTNNQKKVNRRIVIRGNLVMRGKGAIIQGIFVSDTRSKLPFEQVEIAGNLIVGSMYNGIAVLSARDIVVRDNIVQAYPDQQSWIRLTDNRNTSMIGNRSTRFIQQRSEGIIERDNITLRQTRNSKEINKLIANWAVANSDLNRDGPYLREVLARPS